MFSTIKLLSLYVCSILLAFETGICAYDLNALCEQTIDVTRYDSCQLDYQNYNEELNSVKYTICNQQNNSNSNYINSLANILNNIFLMRDASLYIINDVEQGCGNAQQSCYSSLITLIDFTCRTRAFGVALRSEDPDNAYGNLLNSVVQCASAANDRQGQEAPDCQDISNNSTQTHLAELQYYFVNSFYPDLENAVKAVSSV